MSAVRILWAASNSWIGHILGRAGQCPSQRHPQQGITEYFNNRLLKYIPKSPQAIVFGNVVNYGVAVHPTRVTRTYDGAAHVILREHEWAHVTQYRRFGPAFLPAYFAAELWANARGRVNAFETAADRACAKTAPGAPLQITDLQP